MPAYAIAITEYLNYYNQLQALINDPSQESGAVDDAKGLLSGDVPLDLLYKIDNFQEIGETEVPIKKEDLELKLDGIKPAIIQLFTDFPGITSIVEGNQKVTVSGDSVIVDDI